MQLIEEVEPQTAEHREMTSRKTLNSPYLDPEIIKKATASNKKDGDDLLKDYQPF